MIRALNLCCSEVCQNTHRSSVFLRTDRSGCKSAESGNSVKMKNQRNRMSRFLNLGVIAIYTDRGVGPEWVLTRRQRLTKWFGRIYRVNKPLHPKAFKAFVLHQLAEQAKQARPQ